MADTQKNEKDLFEPIWKNIYNKLFERIITLDIAPGSRLSEAQLAASMDVSRSPVKAALDKLCEDRLVEKHSRGGYRVLTMSPADCLELCEARLSIEGHAAYLAAKNISAKQLDTLKALLQAIPRMERDRDFKDYPEVDCAFHRTILEAAENDLLVEMHDIIAPKIMRYHHYGVNIKSVDNMKLVANHIAIYTALKNHQSNTAREEITADISQMKIAAGFLMQKK